MTNFRVVVLAGLVALGLAGPVQAQFTSGSLVVYQVGDGGPSLVNTGNAVYLQEFTTSGSLTGFTLAMPASGGSGPYLIASGTEASEGMLTLGNNGQTLALTGYNTPTGGSTVLRTSSSATINRVVGLVNGQGTASFTSLSDFSTGGSPRGAVTTNGTGIWVTGEAGGVRHTTSGSTTSTQLSTTETNLRGIGVFGSQLYVSSQAGGGIRLGTVGTGTPTTSGQTITNLPGFPTSGGPNQFIFARVGNPATAGPNVLYVADESADVIQKYTFSGSSWTAAGTVAATDVRGLTGAVTGDNQMVIYATTGGSGSAGGGTIYSFSDNAVTTGNISGTATSINTAGSNTAYRGIAFAPANLVWQDAASATWNLSANNWTNTAPSTAVVDQKYVNVYAANFGNISQNNSVTVAAGINPLAVNVTNAANVYTFTNASGNLGIQGMGGLTKSGNGTLVLASANTYSGGTVIAGGTLLANNPDGTGSGTGLGSVRVASGGTLGGSGLITGAVTVESGGTIRGGNHFSTTANTLTTRGALTISSGANVGIRIYDGSRPSSTAGGSTVGAPPNPTSNSFLNIDINNGGTISLSTTANFVIDGTGANFTPNEAYSYQIVGGVGNGFSSLDINDPNRFTTIGFTAENISITGSIAGAIYLNFTPVPEPGTVLGIATAALGLSGLVRRRLRKQDAHHVRLMR